MRRCKVVMLVAAVFVMSAIAQYGQCSLDDKPDGFCTLGSGTTGGAGGATVRVRDYAALKDSLDQTSTMIVEIEGTIDLEGDNVTLRSNKTLIGVGDNATIINGGLETYKQKNIIIRNITFVNSPDDLLKINQQTTNVWVDHCTFLDGDSVSHDTDGLLDITRGSDYITISYCKFYNHDKCILIGHVDNEPLDKEKLRVTLHHNWFDKSLQRHPRVRQGTVHCYNNYYVENGIYGIVSANNAKVLVESCYFLNVNVPTQLGVSGFSGPGDLKEIDNVFEGCGKPESTGKAFDPSSFYSYTADKASEVPRVVTSVAGAGKGRSVRVADSAPGYLPPGFTIRSMLPHGRYTIDGKIIKSVNDHHRATHKGASLVVVKKNDQQSVQKGINLN